MRENSDFLMIAMAGFVFAILLNTLTIISLLKKILEAL